jgi:hypothetical protein
MPEADGPRRIRSNPMVNRPKAVRSRKAALSGVNTKLGTASSIYSRRLRWSQLTSHSSSKIKVVFLANQVETIVRKI